MPHPKSISEHRSAELTELLLKVQKLLDERHPEQGLAALKKAKISSPWVTNAVGVCQLRLGNAALAVELYRHMVIGPGGFVLRTDVPIVFKTNYATALLADNNVVGCLGVLADVRDENNLAVQRLRTAIEEWRSGLSFWQRLRWRMGDQPDRPIPLNFPLGDLE